MALGGFIASQLQSTQQSKSDAVTPAACRLHLIKAISLGIGISSLALFVLLAIGIIDASHLSVKSSYVGVVVGGAILGIGWSIAGFCPGSGAKRSRRRKKRCSAIYFRRLGGCFHFHDSLEGP
jgi:uncharacterized membrane protein YedE/YeeE